MIKSDEKEKKRKERSFQLRLKRKRQKRNTRGILKIIQKGEFMSKRYSGKSFKDAKCYEKSKIEP